MTAGRRENLSKEEDQIIDVDLEEPLLCPLNKMGNFRTYCLQTWGNCPTEKDSSAPDDCPLLNCRIVLQKERER